MKMVAILLLALLLAGCEAESNTLGKPIPVAAPADEPAKSPTSPAVSGVDKVIILIPCGDGLARVRMANSYSEAGQCQYEMETFMATYYPDYRIVAVQLGIISEDPITKERIYVFVERER